MKQAQKQTDKWTLVDAEKLLAALKKYGRHSDLCDNTQWPGTGCICGWQTTEDTLIKAERQP